MLETLQGNEPRSILWMSFEGLKPGDPASPLHCHCHHRRSSAHFGSGGVSLFGRMVAGFSIKGLGQFLLSSIAQKKLCAMMGFVQSHINLCDGRTSATQVSRECTHGEDNRGQPTPLLASYSRDGSRR